MDLRERVRAIVREQVVPLEGDLLRRPFRELLPALTAVRDRVRAEGLWAPCLPREQGGLGLETAAFAPLAGEMGWSPLGAFAFNCQAPDVGTIELLHRHGTAEQKERFLLPLVQGDIRSCFGMTEPEHAGSNPVWLSTRATRDGRGYVLDGHKWFASSADGAAFAVIMALTGDAQSLPHRRASMFIVPTDTAGFRLLRNIPVMGHTGDDWMSHGELVLESCRVEASSLLGEEGAGFALAQERLGPGRVHHAMRWVGVAERALDLTCRRAVARELGPGDPLASRQVVQHAIADSRAEIDAVRLLVLDAAARMDAGGPRAARREISQIKYLAAGMMGRVLDRAVQVHGALGLTDDTILAFLWRHERAARIYDGPDEVHRQLVARLVLREYGWSPSA